MVGVIWLRRKVISMQRIWPGWKLTEKDGRSVLEGDPEDPTSVLPDPDPEDVDRITVRETVHDIYPEGFYEEEGAVLRARTFGSEKQEVDISGPTLASVIAIYRRFRQREIFPTIPYSVKDWTVDPKTGRSNSSRLFHELEREVGRIIRNEAHALIRGDTEGVARFILAQLAHRHGLGPTTKIKPIEE